MSKLELSDFKRLLHELDAQIEERKFVDNRIASSVPFEIKAIGGFALLFHGARSNGVTEDIDSAIEIPSPIMELVHEISLKKNVPWDWLNQHGAHESVWQLESVEWIRIDWNFDNFYLYAVDMISLLHDKLSWTEKYLMQEGISERDRYKDFGDVISLLWTLGINVGDVDEVTDYLIDKGIDIEMYPYFLKAISHDFDE